MYNALKLRFPGLVVEKYIMHYAVTDQTNHAYKYWRAEDNADNSDGRCVSQQVIDFLKAHP